MVNLDSGESRNRQLLCKIARELRDRGYDIAETFSGRRVEEPLNSNSMGILAFSKPRVFGFIPVKGIEAWLYLGDLWIDNEAEGAIPDEQWVFNIYGRGNIKGARELMHQIAQPYNVGVDVRIVRDELRLEGESLYKPN